jgi:hypothetical protein
MSNLANGNDKIIQGKVDWAGDQISAGCLVCKQTFLIKQGQLNRGCPYCGQGILSEQPIRISIKDPELMVDFNPQISPAAILDEFTRDIKFKVDDLNPDALLKRMIRIYWPMYLVDSRVKGDWEGNAGFNYEVQSSQEIFHSGQWDTRSQLEKRQRWEVRRGSIDRSYNNICVPALSVYQYLSQKLGMINYELAHGFRCELTMEANIWMPDMIPEENWPMAEAALNLMVESDCKKASKADYFRDLNLRVTYENRNWTQIFLPMFSTYYVDDDAKPHIILINGQTGQISGARLASQQKGWKTAGIMAGLALLLAIAGFILLLLGAVLPPAALLGIILIGAGIILLLSASIPAIAPYQWNRRQMEEKITTIPGVDKQ